MCNQHSHHEAWRHVQELIEIVKDDAGYHEPDQILCQHLVDESLVPRWSDHTDQPCEPIAILEILDLDGEYRPAATLVLRGDPARPFDGLHYRADYTLRVQKDRSLIDRILRRAGTKLPMGHQRGHDPNAVMDMTTNGLSRILHREAGRPMRHALEKGKIWPPEE